MTDQGPSLSEELFSRARTVPGRALAVSALRSLGVVALTLVVYAVAPTQGDTTLRAAVGGSLLVMGVVAVAFVRQLRRISRAEWPTLAAVEALVLVVGVFLTMQALVYVSLSAGDPAAAFTEPLDKVDGLYFAVTVMTTVGFGDITAANGLTRGFVTFQMLVNLVLVGTAVRVLTSSTRRVLAARTARTDVETGDPGAGGPRHAGRDGA